MYAPRLPWTSAHTGYLTLSQLPTVAFYLALFLVWDDLQCGQSFQTWLLLAPLAYVPICVLVLRRLRLFYGHDRPPEGALTTEDDICSCPCLEPVLSLKQRNVFVLVLIGFSMTTWPIVGTVFLVRGGRFQLDDARCATSASSFVTNGTIPGQWELTRCWPCGTDLEFQRCANLHSIDLTSAPFFEYSRLWGLLIGNVAWMYLVLLFFVTMALFHAILHWNRILIETDRRLRVVHHGDEDSTDEEQEDDEAV